MMCVQENIETLNNISVKGNMFVAIRNFKKVSRVIINNLNLFFSFYVVNADKLWKLFIVYVVKCSQECVSININVLLPLFNFICIIFSTISEIKICWKNLVYYYSRYYYLRNVDVIKIWRMFLNVFLF